MSGKKSKNVNTVSESLKMILFPVTQDQEIQQILTIEKLELESFLALLLEKSLKLLIDYQKSVVVFSFDALLIE